MWDSDKQSAKLIDMSVPQDYDMVSVTAGKITNYKYMLIEIKKCWNLKEAKIVPIVIGALGTVCNRFDDHLTPISSEEMPHVVHKTALLRTAHIVRNFLT